MTVNDSVNFDTEAIHITFEIGFFVAVGRMFAGAYNAKSEMYLLRVNMITESCSSSIYHALRSTNTPVIETGLTAYIYSSRVCS